jgi:hypothetical protein
MKQKGYVAPTGYNKDSAKTHQLVYTIAQWVMAVIVIGVGAIALLVAGVFTLWSSAWQLTVCAAEFVVLLMVGLAGGLIPKGDYPIHTIGEELLQQGDWHEHLRSLYRKKWLNFLPDIFGLLPAFFLFCVANTMIYNAWRYDFPVWLVMFWNIVLLALAVGMIPLVSGMAHAEVQQQVLENDKLRLKEQRQSSLE